MTAEYDNIGKTYTSTRVADPRISQQLIDLLALSPRSRIVDIGAGSGNYSRALAEQGFRVTAVEPSAVKGYCTGLSGNCDRDLQSHLLA